MLVNVQCKSGNMRKSSSQQIVEQINLNEPLHISNDAELENAFHFWQVLQARDTSTVFILFLPAQNYQKQIMYW